MHTQTHERWSGSHLPQSYSGVVRSLQHWHETFREDHIKACATPQPFKHIQQPSGLWCASGWQMYSNATSGTSGISPISSYKHTQSFWFKQTSTVSLRMLRMSNNESATYIMSGNNFSMNNYLFLHAILCSHYLILSLSLSPAVFLFFSLSLIVCNSYRVSLRPTSVASNSAVG